MENNLKLKYFTMTKKQLQSAWKKVIKETHKIPNWDALKRNSRQYRRVVMLRELILFCQVLLEKIEMGKNTAFNTIIFKKTINFYCAQMKEYV
ncbi:hypothetical protein COU24_01065 [Candidatus Kuenenbacteria bacterium CG10_big_fil_rev_8_21_14_0_10_39_14]|uniref:Uncharacterized protein n=4 Tax=Candidatus Kueneniibacteriota TaxID=1752740 RepID=A0A2H0U697_9BACT|nr:MAG: hypothetical protein COU24_01065 [Candidatus Kuenenbacteria bacterium CG10_big_fil_rev_8_21_14_0_10_39_14]